jgi:hypothetical protein
MKAKSKRTFDPISAAAATAAAADDGVKACFGEGSGHTLSHDAIAIDQDGLDFLVHCAGIFRGGFRVHSAFRCQLSA